MDIRGMDRFRRPIALGVILPLFCVSADVSAFAQASDKSAIHISNLDWKVQGDVAVITYDLEAPAGETYEVSVLLLKEDDPSFSVTPKAVSGDCGEVRLPGKGKQVLWEFKKDVPGGLLGEGYYFEVSVEKAGGGPWLYIALGAAAAGGAAALLLLKKTEETTPVTKELPLPPLRP